MSANVPPATVARLRLASQWILPRTSTSPAPGPVDVVRWLTALQGQDLPGVLFSIGLRAPGSTRADVAAGFNRGEIVRSWPMRGTLHVTAAEDLGWILGLTGGRMVTGMATRHRQLGITTADLEQVREAALALLEPAGGQRCGRATREDLLAAFRAAGQRTDGQRGIHLLWLLCLTGTLVQGPLVGGAGNGTHQHFVRMDQWIAHPRVLAREEALAELALRYFRSHGPATVRDFQWWTKLTLKDVTAGLQRARGELECLDCNGVRHWLAPETATLLGSGPAPGARSVLLLPGFDEYLLGYADRGAALAPDHAALTVPGGNGMFKATVVAGGQVVGTWRKGKGAAEKRREVAGVVLPELFGELSPARHKALEKSAAAYARFLSTN